MSDTASAQIANCLDHLPSQNGESGVRLRDFVEGMAAPLRLHGHEVRLAYDGQSDLEEAHAFRPHVMFLDLDLPKLGGYEVAGRLRLEPAMRDRTLVAMTGYDQEEDRQRTQEAGF
jgi:CheY-like chemotaxis protein